MTYEGQPEDFDVMRDASRWNRGRPFIVHHDGKDTHYNATVAWREEDGRLLVAGPVTVEHDRTDGPEGPGKGPVSWMSLQYLYGDVYEPGTWTIDITLAE
ncbi:hypothetical protein ACLTEW_18460 [Gordonia lacunae]|uniref:hypothetical protein n=1 Tax=Gordonia lacunae TaxID=417102 RepID=UPI0039E68540